MLKILDEIKCEIWVSPDDQGVPPKGQTTLKIPSLEDILEQTNSCDIQYNYNESWEQAKNETVCIIHTSGTTGKHKIKNRKEKRSTCQLTYLQTRYPKAHLPSQWLHVGF